MKKYYLFAVILIIMTLMSSCTSTTSKALNITQKINFTDSMGNEIQMNYPKKAAVLSGSLAEIWALAGGELYGVHNFQKYRCFKDNNNSDRNSSIKPF